MRAFAMHKGSLRLRRGIDFTKPDDIAKQEISVDDACFRFGLGHIAVYSSACKVLNFVEKTTQVLGFGRYHLSIASFSLLINEC